MTKPARAPIEKPDLFIVARFLDHLWRPDGEVEPEVSKSKLQVAVRLNYDQFRRYLDFLEMRSFVQITETPGGEHRVRIAPKGREAHRGLVTWLRAVFGESAFKTGPLESPAAARRVDSERRVQES